MAATSLLLLCANFVGADTSFLKEAQAKWTEYLKFAQRIQGTKTTIIKDRLAHDKVLAENRIELKSRGFAMLYRFQFGGPIAEPRDECHVRNHHYGFSLRRKLATDDWTVPQFYPSIGDGKNVGNQVGGLGSFLNDDTGSTFAPYSLDGSWLPNLVKETEFHAKKTERIRKNGLELIAVDFEYAKPPKSWTLQSGRILFDPSLYWAVRECDLVIATGDGYTNAVGYSAEFKQGPSGFPLLHKSVRHSDCPAEKSRSIAISEYALHERVPPLEDFTLSAFGFPEVKDFPQTPGSTPWVHWLAIVAAASFLFAFLIRRRARTMAGRAGFTLIELMIVIAIIGILIALLVPAVQQIRGSALRVECLNNLKQIGLAAHQFHDGTKAFPAGMRGQEPHKFSSWLAALLPYVEQGNLWHVMQDAYEQSASPFKNPPHVGLATPLRVYSCPADGRGEQAAIATIDQYPVAFTSYLGVSGKDLQSLDGVLYRDSRIRMGDISDGTSQTLLAGERPPSANLQFGWWYAGVGQKFTGSADVVLGVEEQNVLPIVKGGCPPGTYKFEPGNIGNQCDMFHFWSPHTGGAHFLFADGSARLLRYSAAPIMPALASRAGNEVANSLE